MRHFFKDHFIPHAGNNYHPHALHPHALSVYALFSIALKLVVVLALAFTYQTPEVFAAVSTEKVIGLANTARVTQGLPALTPNALLNDAALQKANDMLSNNYFAHYAPDGTTPWDFFHNVDYRYAYAGENLAMNFIDTERVHDAWMASPTHRANIMNPVYRDIGVAVVTGQIDGKETTLLVQLFGSSLVPTLAQEQQNTAPIETDMTTSSGEIISGEETQSTLTQAPAGFLSFLLSYSDMFYVTLLVFLGIALALKIFINIRIQHKVVIAKSLALAGVLLLLANVPLHFLETLTSKLLII